MQKSIFVALLIIAIVVGFGLLNSLNFDTVQASTNIQNFTYVLPNYNVTYAIKEMPPPDSSSINPYSYNIVVYGPPPFPIQIDFYDQNRDNIVVKKSHIMQTDYISTSIGCIGYPTQITMMQIDNESVASTPNNTSLLSPSKPSVPEFTLRYVDLSYDVPPIYGTDQYTGQTIITQDGYRIDNRSLQFIIKNQYFTPYADSNGTQIGLYFNFRIKGAYVNEWRYYPFASNGYTTRRYGEFLGGNSTESPADFVQSNLDYTTISIAIRSLLFEVPVVAELEVQAQALIGYMERTDYMMAGVLYVFTGELGSWSNTQTITIGESQTLTPSPSPSPTVVLPSPTPTPPNNGPTSQPTSPTPLELEAIVGITILIAVLGVGIGFLVYLIKKK